MSALIPKKDLINYSIVAMPIAFAGIPLYIHAPDFYATQYGVSISNLAFVLLFLRFLDAVQDPIIGYFSDRFAKYRIMFMPLAAIILMLSFMLLFKPLTSNYLWWFSIFIFLTTTAFSILIINLNSLGGIWGEDKNQKTTIAAYREAFGIVGLILAVTLPSVLQNQMPKEQAYFYLGITLAVTMILGVLFFNRWQRQHPDINFIKNSEQFSIRVLFNIPHKIRHFFVVYAVSMLASSIPAVLVLFFIRDRLNLETYTGLFLLIYFLSGIVGVNFCSVISRHIGKNNSWVFAMIIGVSGFVWAYFLKEGDFWSYLSICVISGVAFGFELVLPASILADHIKTENKENYSSVYYGILAFLLKFSLALATAAVLPYLENVGFVPVQANTESVLQNLSVCYSLLPCVIKIIAIFLLWRVSYENNINSNRGVNHA